MMAKFTKINKETCIACGACSGEAPDVYAEDSQGIAYSLLDDNKGQVAIDDEFLEDVEFAQEGCPTESVLVQDSPF
jgi:ferredoxin